jgi:hypothetical protein
MVVELAEAFFLAKAVELGEDDDGRGLVGGACELKNFSVVEPSAWPRRPATVFRSVPAARSVNPILLDKGIRSLAGVPLLVHGAVIGSQVRDDDQVSEPYRPFRANFAETGHRSRRRDSGRIQVVKVENKGEGLSPPAHPGRRLRRPFSDQPSGKRRPG